MIDEHFRISLMSLKISEIPNMLQLSKRKYLLDSVLSRKMSSVFENIRYLTNKVPTQIIFLFLSEYRVIPPRIPKHMICNDRFFFNCEEWDIPSVKKIRMYWDTLFKNVHKNKEKENIWHVCKNILNLLPGEKSLCVACGWFIPIESMHNGNICEYCCDVHKKK